MMKWLYISLLFFLPVLIQAKPKVESQLSINEILIGEQIELTVSLTAADISEVKWPTLNDTLGPNLEIISISNLDTLRDDQTVRLSQKIVFTSFEEGFWALLPLQIQAGDEIIETEASVITVKTIPLDTARNITDIKGIEHVSLSFWDYLIIYRYYITGALLLLLLAFALYWYLKNKPQPKPVEKVIVEPQRPAHEIALEKLQQLKSKEYWQKGDFKTYYSELSDILREYIELRYQVPALELTTEEILHNLRLTEATESNKRSLLQVLKLSDLVKFAKEKPVQLENEKALSQAIAFIEDTKEETVESNSEGKDKEELS